MLYLQHINVTWGKECRGAPYSSIRTAMANAVVLPKQYGAYNVRPIQLHYLHLRQEKRGFEERINRVEYLDFADNMRVGALRVNSLPAGPCFVTYCYNWHVGAIPVRHKYDVTTSRYVTLQEAAFVLATGQYGRATYNGRFVDYDRGNWWYGLDIVNIIQGGACACDMFTRRAPDVVYKQIKRLL